MDPSNSFMKNTPAGSFGHTGFTGTSICVIPSSNTTIIILINRQHMGLNEKGEYFNPNPIRAAICQLTQEEFIN
jgi:CubicO group peptidase (beta-lactamase class C family)